MRAASHVLGRARRLLKAAELDDLPTGVASDLRRLAVVMGVAALDTYMHVLVYKNAYASDPMPPSLAQLDICFGELIGLADAAVAARREGIDGRPKVAAKNALQKRLLRETFQRYDDVSRGLAMAGQAGLWTDVGARLSDTNTAVKIRHRLNGIVHRQNQIVHEGDLQRQSRPRRPRLNPMGDDEARADLNYMRRLIEAIDAAIASRSS
jgi:hypothetical protein